MSSLVVLKLSIVDEQCLEEALKKLNLDYTKVGRNFRLRGNGELVYTELGYEYQATDVSADDKYLLGRIREEYEKIYNRMIKRLEEKERIKQYLSEKDLKEVNELRSRIQEKNRKLQEAMIARIERKARERGFTIKKNKLEDGSIQIVLVRRK